jgi:hypothetical protein
MEIAMSLSPEKFEQKIDNMAAIHVAKQKALSHSVAIQFVAEFFGTAEHNQAIGTAFADIDSTWEDKVGCVAEAGELLAAIAAEFNPPFDDWYTILSDAAKAYGDLMNTAGALPEDEAVATEFRRIITSSLTPAARG